jgi:SAM-dependent methyltransferase
MVGAAGAPHTAAMTPTQSWDPLAYAKNARFVSDLAGPVLQLLEARPGERILDLGCGDGVLTAALAAQGCAVLGVDSSAAQVQATVARGVPAEQLGGEDLLAATHLHERFDAVFSNAALHWMKDPSPVIAGVSRVLAPGGRFVAELGGHGCVAGVRAGLAAALARRNLDELTLCPWYFPSDDQYRALLEAANLQVESMVLVPRPTPLPGAMHAWLETFAQTYTAALPAADRPAFLAEVEESLRPTLCDAGGRWTADYVRLRFRARKRPTA